MNKTELTVFIAIVLFVAFALGWFANWLIYRFTRVTRGEISELDRMAQALHDAEETRDQAIVYIQQRESTLNAQLTQAQAELKAAMDGLRDARHEADELRDYIEKTRK
ncbi:hypothetical protein BVG79_00388 [Ketogulonicigenium robustum]|uniref:Uncharacterized protein n=1 Tax=Ketogulonicigenium robustum TaxID=92947 RepID=A0A1W6NWZ7_9RHOB|nr:hypothetical protein [Ketogulonicigenium robustum]ARO13744.1 hypothetical protein BVG79_00388 [Ketogulonicigenium robustum]